MIHFKKNCKFFNFDACQKQKKKIMEKELSYVVEERLSKTTYTSTFLVHDADDPSSKMVVKKLNTNVLSNEEINRIEQESKILPKLKASNLIRYYQIRKTSSTITILMEHANSGSLEELIFCHQNDMKRLSENVILDIFVQLLIGVKYLHDRKIIHRALCPNNIFLHTNNKTNSFPIVKIGGFENFRPLIKTDEFVTSMNIDEQYSAPEVQSGLPYTNKSDVWSLGCILYELCTLKKANICTIELSKPPKISTSFSKDLQFLIDSMLNTDPKQRPSISELLENDLIKQKYEQILGTTLAESEMNHTVFHGKDAGEGPDTLKVLKERDDSKQVLINDVKEVKCNNDVLLCSSQNKNSLEYIERFLKSIHGEERYNELLQIVQKMNQNEIVSDIELSQAEKHSLNLLSQTPLP